jgi:hypothetical protein
VPVRNRVAQTEPFAKNALGKPVRNCGTGIRAREFPPQGLVESSRLEHDATVCFLWVSEGSNNSCSRLERDFAIEIRERHWPILEPGRNSPMVCFERVTLHSTFCAEPGRSEFTLVEGPAVLQRESRFLVAAGEIDKVGGLRGCEWWGTVSLLRIVGLRVSASG